MESTIFAQIRKEKDDFIHNEVPIVSGHSFSQYDTIKRIHLLLNNKFEDSSLYLGKEKLFFDIVTPACEVATRMLNVDTKDIKLLPLNPKSIYSTYLLEKELKQWLKNSELANVLNQIAEEAPRYGSVVLEKTKDGAKVVDLRRLFMDASVEKLKDSRFVTTISYMTPEELEATGWDNVDIAIRNCSSLGGQDSYEDSDGNINQTVSSPYIKVYKRYGSVPQWWLDGGRSEKKVKALFIVAGAEKREVNEKGEVTGELGVVLFKSKWIKEWPFKDYHYNKIKGRWLGRGIVESLNDTQIRMNELKNLKRISMELSSIHLFQTKDKTIVRNVLTDLENGDLITSASGIEPIANEERNLPSFKDEEQSYFEQSQRLSFAYDAVSGEQSAASTTATSVINAQQQATSTFGFKRENFTNMLRDFFNDLVLPQLMNDLSAEHIMRFTGNSQELQKLDQAAAEIYANDEIKKIALSGKLPTPEIQQALKDKFIAEHQKMGESRFLKIKDDFYDDAEFEFDFNIGNEQINPSLLADNLNRFLASYNPAFMNDPRYKVYSDKYSESLGISPAEIEFADQQAQDIVKTNPQMMGLPQPQAPVQAPPSGNPQPLPRMPIMK